MSYPSAYDTFTDVKKYGDTITESITVPISTTSVVVNTTYPLLDQIVISGYTPVTTVPTTGQYRPFSKTTQLEFGPQGAASTVSISYRTWGTPMADLPMQALIDAIESVETTLGLNPQGAYGTVAERFAAIIATGTHQHTSYDLTSQIDGVRDTFTLAETPLFPESTLVLFNGLPLDMDTDYILDGANIIFTDPDAKPVVGETLRAYYAKS